MTTATPSWFATHAMRTRTLMLMKLGPEYWTVVRPAMQEIETLMSQEGRTALESFESLCKPYIEAGDLQPINTYMAAVVEIYKARLKQ